MKPASMAPTTAAAPPRTPTPVFPSAHGRAPSADKPTTELFSTAPVGPSAGGRAALPAHPFRRAEAAALGLTPSDLSRLRAEGALLQPLRGIHLAAGLADEPVARARAVALALPPGAAVCRSVAAWLHGVDPRGPWERDEPLPLQCLVPRGTEPPDWPGVSAHVDHLPAHDIEILQGIPVTNAARTALDLLRTLAPHMALAVLDALAHRSLVDPRAIATRMEEWAGQRGIAQARRLVALCEPAAESYGESWLRLRILDAGFPAPVAQIWVTDDAGRGVYRLDLGWPGPRIGIEYDGMEFHETADQQRRDRDRRADLARRWGWQVWGVGRGEVLGPSMALERGAGELLGLAPQTTLRAW